MEGRGAPGRCAPRLERAPPIQPPLMDARFSKFQEKWGRLDFQVNFSYWNILGRPDHVHGQSHDGPAIATLHRFHTSWVLSPHVT